MSVQNADIMFKNVVTKGVHLRNLENELRAELEKAYVDKNDHDIATVIVNAVQTANVNSSMNFPYPILHKYLTEILAQSNTFSDLSIQLMDSNLFEVKKQMAIREAERLDQWKLWRDKLARWFMGGSAALVLYSIFVALSEKWDFIKIPVRDMVIGG